MTTNHSLPLFGIDLGGTKIEGAVMDPQHPGEALVRLRLPTEARKGYDHILSQIREVCCQLAHRSALPFPKKIGIGTPGILDPQTQTLKNSNTQCLNGKALQSDLESLLQTECMLANDANCFALAEATLGAASGYETVFGVIMGTGVGGGIIVHKRILTGRHGIAGEWGQLILDPEGDLSGYGTRGTIETILSGPALEKFYARQSGTHRSLKEICQRAHQDDPHARATIDRLTDSFARAIAIIIDVLDPHAIVLGGGVGNIDALYSEETRKKIQSHIFNPTFEAALLKPKLGDSAGVFGAAMLLL